MSRGIILRMAISNWNLTTELRVIYAYFTSCIRGEDTSSPTVGEISKDLSMCEDRFRKHQKNLIEREYLTIRKNAAANGRYSTNVYMIQERVANG